MREADLRLFRRRQLGIALAATVLTATWPAAAAGAGSAPASPQDLGDPRFAALRRPALRVRQPERCGLLAAVETAGRIVAVGERGVIALSDDGGRRWRQASQVPVSVTLTGVQFVGGGVGFAIGHGGTVLVSEDHGEHWTIRADGSLLAQVAAEAAAQRPAIADPRGAAFARDAALLVRDGPDKPLLDLRFFDEDHGVVIGSYNLFFQTSDRGRSWQCRMADLDNPKSLHLYALGVRDHTWMIAGEQGLLLCSRDGGQSFSRLKSPYNGSWFALAPVAPASWLVAGLRGHVYRSRDDGGHWEAIQGMPPASVVSIARVADGSCLLVNQAGQLLRLPAEGAAEIREMPAMPSPAQVLPLADGGLLALGLAGATRLAQGRS